MRTREAWLLSAALLACGPANSGTATDATGTDAGSSTGAAPTTDAGSSTGSTGAVPGDPTTPTATTDAASTSPTSTTGAPTTDAATDPAATTTDVTGTTEATTDADDTGTTDADDTGTTGDQAVITRAWFVNGTGRQVRIFQWQPASELCTVHLVNLLADGGGESPKYAAVDRPEGWGIHIVAVYQGQGECFDPYMWYRNPNAQASGAVGTITFHDLGPDEKPATLDIDVVGTYAPGEPWVPAEVPVVAVAVPVDVG